MAVFVGAGILLASGLVAAASAAVVPIVLVSTDPYTNTGYTHATEVEPDTFSFGNTIVGTFQVGRATSAQGGGCSNIGWTTSTDNGATWVHGFLPGTTVVATPPGVAGRISDPVVAYDARHGVWLIHTIPITAAGTVFGIWVSRSTDGGLTWGNPIQTQTQNNLDKNWLVCDNSETSPYYGNCYAEWDNNGSGNLMQMQTSHDGGLTWDAVRTPSGNPTGLGGQPVVTNNGTVVVPYRSNGAQERSFRSTDGGATWSAFVGIGGNISTHTVAGGLRTSPLPSAEVDPQGRVYVVWQDSRFRTGGASNDIVMSTSSDGGATWSAITRIPIDDVTSTVDHFIPGIAVDWTRSGPPAYLALTYYYYPVAACTAATCQLYVGFISSLDGGVTWSTPTQVAGPMTLSWVANSNQGPMVGDYMSTSIGHDYKAHPVFAVATAPVGGVFDEGMYAPQGGLALRPMFPSLNKPATRRAGGDRPVFFGADLPAQWLTAH